MAEDNNSERWYQVKLPSLHSAGLATVVLTWLVLATMIITISIRGGGKQTEAISVLAILTGPAMNIMATWLEILKDERRNRREQDE
jgi:hypothetical protein|tara:strand:- start:106 stop:363 length:258 start_codon:yes stop_codon:yes gene_type:complete